MTKNELTFVVTALVLATVGVYLANVAIDAIIDAQMTSAQYKTLRAVRGTAVSVVEWFQ